jgi:hypothetical protein
MKYIFQYHLQKNHRDLFSVKLLIIFFTNSQSIFWVSCVIHHWSRHDWSQIRSSMSVTVESQFAASIEFAGKTEVGAPLTLRVGGDKDEYVSIAVICMIY